MLSILNTFILEQYINNNRKNLSCISSMTLFNINIKSYDKDQSKMLCKKKCLFAVEIITQSPVSLQWQIQDFPWGRQPPKFVRIYYLANFCSKNRMKIKEIRPMRRGRRPWRPLRSVDVLCTKQMGFIRSHRILFEINEKIEKIFHGLLGLSIAIYLPS